MNVKVKIYSLYPWLYSALWSHSSVTIWGTVFVTTPCAATLSSSVVSSSKEAWKAVIIVIMPFFPLQELCFLWEVRKFQVIWKIKDGLLLEIHAQVIVTVILHTISTLPLLSSSATASLPSTVVLNRFKKQMIISAPVSSAGTELLKRLILVTKRCYECLNSFRVFKT